MKKAFIIILLFYIGFHLVFPKIYFLFFGDFYLYSDLADEVSANKAFWLNVIPIFITIILIWFFAKNHTIPPVINSTAASELFVFAIIYNLVFLFSSGGFEGIISGAMSGSVLNYINLFLNAGKLLMCAFLLQKRKVSLIWLSLVYIIVSTIAGSRSAILTVLIMALVGLAFVNFELYKRRLISFFKYSFVIAPLLFAIATNLRYSSDIRFDYKLLTDIIVARISSIESGMIAVHYLDSGTSDLSLFYEKYGIIHQLKLIVDSLIPGDIFGHDVMPNNYFRSVFLGYTEEFVIDNYMSMNMTLPVYLYMFFGLWSIPITVFFFCGFYFLISKLRNYPFMVLLLLSLVYECCIYFDWVMIYNSFFVGLLTIGTLKIYIFLRHNFIDIVKKHHKEISSELHD